MHWQMISNCEMSTVPRLQYAEALMQHVPIHSYGKCLHNTDWPTDSDLDYSREMYHSKYVLSWPCFQEGCVLS